MTTRHPSGVVLQTVEYTSLEFRAGVSCGYRSRSHYHWLWYLKLWGGLTHQANDCICTREKVQRREHCGSKKSREV